MNAVRRGRPRDDGADTAIVAAALELIAEQGIGALTVEAVATKAGVGKTTLYRRWQGKHDLVRHAFSTLNEDLPPVPEGPVADCLADVLTGLALVARQQLPMRLFPRVIGHRRSDPETYLCFFRRVIAPRRERVRQVLEAGQRQGEVRDDVDLEHVVNVLIGPMIYQMTVLPDGSQEASMSPRELVELVLHGIAGPARELPLAR